MNASGLNQGTSGNISARYKDVLLITPSASPYDSMTPETIAAMPLEGEYGSWSDSGAIDGVAVSLRHYEVAAGRRRDRPHTFDLCDGPGDSPQGDTRLPLHDRGRFGGTTVRCAGYARYGTKELSDLALKALEGRHACLLANHGMIALGSSLEKAMWLAIELETIARQYYLALALGPPIHPDRRTDRRNRARIHDLRSAGQARDRSRASHEGEGQRGAIEYRVEAPQPAAPSNSGGRRSWNRANFESRLYCEGVTPRSLRKWRLKLEMLA